MLDFLFEPVLVGPEYAYGIFGSLLGLGASLIGGIGKRKAAKAEAEAARLNAQQIEERSGIEQVLRGREGTREAGTIAASAGASGLDLAGSAAEILRESARNTAFDIQSIQKQRGLQAKALRKGAKASSAAGNIALGGSIIGGASDFLIDQGL